MTNIDKTIEYAKAMGAEKGGVVMDEDTVRQALLEIQKETARKFVSILPKKNFETFYSTTCSKCIDKDCLKKEDFTAKGWNSARFEVTQVYKQITGEDYE